MIHEAVLHHRAELAAEAAVMRKLWRAVLLHALREAKGQIARTGGMQRASALHLEQRRARDWIGSRDFREVCDLAGISISAEEALAAVDGPLGELLIRKSRHDA